MFISQEIVDEYFVYTLNENTDEQGQAIYATDVNHLEPFNSLLIGDDDDVIWLKKDGAGENSWYWSTKDSWHKNGWIFPEPPKKMDKILKKETYVTRYVLDIEWEGVDGVYGDHDGSDDCGTVHGVYTFLKKAIEDGTLKVYDTIPVRVDWISYVTNVEHDHPETITGGRALHPTLRKSKGLWSKPKAKKAKKIVFEDLDWEKNIVICKHESGFETAFILSSDSPEGSISTWQQNKLPYNLKFQPDEVWWFQDDWKWRHSNKEEVEEEGWDLTPLFEKETEDLPHHKDQVFYDPALVPSPWYEIKEQAKALGFKWAVSHSANWDYDQLMIYDVSTASPAIKLNTLLCELEG